MPRNKDKTTGSLATRRDHGLRRKKKSNVKAQKTLVALSHHQEVVILTPETPAVLLDHHQTIATVTTKRTSSTTLSSLKLCQTPNDGRNQSKYQIPQDTMGIDKRWTDG